jgi:thioredoxin reductase
MIARYAKGDGPNARADATYDVVVVGGGPAGLSAALILGRCRRRVIVLDSGHPRNAAALAMHGYLTRDGIAPRKLLEIGRAELASYKVEVRDTEVISARCLAPEHPASPGPAFEVTAANGEAFASRKLLLATGVNDILPEIEGIADFYGRGVHHCPYCDGWEHRDGHLIAYGKGAPAAGLALSLKTWSDHVTACTDGGRLSPEDKQKLQDNGIALRTQRIARLEGTGEVLQRVVLKSGPPLACDALFFNTGHAQHSKLPEMLGCPPREKGAVPTHDKQRTEVPGLFLAGDADDDVQFVIVAAAEGARAAVAINRELQDEDRSTPRPPQDVPTLRLHDDGRGRARAGRRTSRGGGSR